MERTLASTLSLTSSAAGAEMGMMPARERNAHTRLGDTDIRAALLKRLRATHSDDTLIIEEMGLWQGRARVDVAVVNGSLSGFEIKSDRDTLMRLGRQQDFYGRCFDTMTIVVGRRYLSAARKILPAWWGIIEATHVGGGVKLVPRRREKRNSNVCPEALARLAWKAEAIAILQSHGVMADFESLTRQQLWSKMLQRMSVRSIRDAVREKIKARGDWRSDPELSRYGGSQRTLATSMPHHHPLHLLLSPESAHLPS